MKKTILVKKVETFEWEIAFKGTLEELKELKKERLKYMDGINSWLDVEYNLTYIMGADPRVDYAIEDSEKFKLHKLEEKSYKLINDKSLKEILEIENYIKNSLIKHKLLINERELFKENLLSLIKDKKNKGEYEFFIELRFESEWEDADGDNQFIFSRIRLSEDELEDIENWDTREGSIQLFFIGDCSGYFKYDDSYRYIRIQEIINFNEDMHNMVDVVIV